MDRQLHIVLLEKKPADAEMIQRALGSGGVVCTIERIETRKDYLRALDRGVPDVVLADHCLSGFDGHTALAILRKRYPQVPFIFVSARFEEDSTGQALDNGVTDYVLKLRLARLAPVVLRAVRESRERVERRMALEHLLRSNQQLRALSARLQKIREDERIRISRAVHDELGQALTGLKLDLSWIASQLPKRSAKLLEKTRSMSMHIEETIATVRRISADLRPGVLDHLGLEAALEWQAGEFEKRTGLKCTVQCVLDEAILDPEVNTALFRDFQESLTNVVRHAHATRVDVRLYAVGPELVLEIADNGRGITREDTVKAASLGLLGMRERAALLGGSLEINGEAGRGTMVRISVPLRRSSLNQPKQIAHENTHHRRPRRRASRFEANPEH